MIHSRVQLDLIQELANSTEVLHGQSKKRLHNFLLTLNQRISNIEQNHTPTFMRETPTGKGTIFQISHIPIIDSLDLYKVVAGTGLVPLIPGIDYVITGKHISLKVAPAVPLLAQYRHNES